MWTWGLARSVRGRIGAVDANVVNDTFCTSEVLIAAFLSCVKQEEVLHTRLLPNLPYVVVVDASILVVEGEMPVIEAFI
jgi:hypothetical protein